MKKVIALSLMFVLLFSCAVFATVSLDVKWQIAVDTLRPGGETTISLTISNTGTEHLTNVVITPTGGPYMTATSGKIDLGGLSASGSSQGSITIRVNTNAPSTTSYVYLDVNYYTGTASYKKTFSIPITIKREPLLQIINVNYSDVISPGKTLTLSFDIKNSGLGPAKDLVVTLDKSDVFTLSQSAGEAVISSLDPEEEKKLSFGIVIDPEADVGINSISVNLKYYDETKVNSYSETKYIGLVITGKINFVATVEDAIGSVAKISIANSGTAPAEYVTINAKSGAVEKNYYIGSIDSNDNEIIDFPQPTTSGKYEVDLEISYRDKFNNEYTEYKTITVKPSISTGPFIIILVIVIIGAGSYFYLKKRKRKKVI